MDEIELEKVITELDIERFIEMSGDDNPLHTDEEFASNTIYKGRIAHGLIPFSLVSTCLTRLCGPGTVWVSQTFNFKHPTRIGDKITVNARITDKRGRISYIKVEGRNQKDKIIFDGESKIIQIADIQI